MIDVTYQLVINFNRPELDNSAFGIVAGVLYATTGKSYEYNSTLYTGGLLSKEGIPSFQEYIDIQKSGGYANFSQISFELNIKTGLLSWLRTNNVIIRGATVSMGISIDRGNPNFRWFGKVDEADSNRKFLILTCSDLFNVIHSNQPSTPISLLNAGGDNQNPVPLMIGRDEFSKLVEKQNGGIMNYSLERGGPTLRSDNIYILGYTANLKERQGTKFLDRYFGVKGWNQITLFCGSNSSITEDSLTDYFLTFEDQINEREFYGRVIGNSPSYKAGIKWSGSGESDFYAVDVILDKAVPFEMEQIPDSELNPDWDAFVPIEDFEAVYGTQMNRFYGMDKTLVTDEFVNRNGWVTQWGGRAWANYDEISNGPTIIQLYSTRFPINYPTTYPDYDPEDPPLNLGVIRWVPVNKISRAAFSPYAWTSIGEDGEEVVTPIKPNALGEPIFFYGNDGSGFKKAVILNVNRSVTTKATLRHKGYFSDFWIAENARNIPSSAVILKTPARKEILRAFEYDGAGTVRIQNPEWSFRIGDLGDEDEEKKVPFKESYQIYGPIKGCQVYGDNFNAHNLIFQKGAIPTIDYGAIRKRKTEYLCSGYITDSSQNIFDWSGNIGTFWRGNLTQVSYRGPELGTVETQANGRTPGLVLKDPSWLNYRSVSEYGMGFIFPRVEDSEFNFFGKIQLTKLRENGVLILPEAMNVFMRVKGYEENPFENPSSEIYDSGYVSLSSKKVDSDVWSSVIGAGKEFALHIGSTSFEFDTLVSKESLIACTFPTQVLEKIEESNYFEVQIFVGIDAQDDWRIGLQPSFVNLIGFEDVSKGATYDEGTTGVANPVHYPEAVKEVITDFDKAPSLISYVDNSLQSEYENAGGGYPEVGRQFLQATNTFSLCSDLASRGFFGITIDNQGRRSLVPWLYRKTPVKKFATVISPSDTEYSPIVNKSLNKFSSTPYSMVYTHANIKFAENESGGYDGFLKIDKTEEESFPDSESYTIEEAPIGGLWVVYDYGSQYAFFEIANVNLPSAWVGGVKILVKPNASDGGKGILCEIVGVVKKDAFNSVVYFNRLDTSDPRNNFYLESGAAIASAGTTSGVLTWNTFVSCSESLSYAEAETMWLEFRGAYQRRGGRNDLSPELATVPELRRSANGSAANVIAYVKNLYNWVTFPKEKAIFPVFIQDAYNLNILDCIAVRDPDLTEGLDFIGWIYNYEIDTKDGVVNLGVIFDKSPFDPVEVKGTIDEGISQTGGTLPVDDIDEGISQTGGTLPVDDIDEQ